MPHKYVLVRHEDGVVTITLNRPEKANALNLQMTQELRSAVQGVAQDDLARVLVLTGAGRIFMGGGDVAEDKSYREMDQETYREWMRSQVHPITRGLRQLPIPTIAMVNGAAVGGGFDWALACDIRIGSENARFCNAFIRVGLVPETGMAHLLPQIVGLGRALHILFSGDFVEAAEAERIGLLSRVVPAADLEKETMALAHKLAQAPALAAKLTKTLAYHGLVTNLDTALEMAATFQAQAMFSQEHIEGVTAFLEKRAPVYRKA